MADLLFSGVDGERLGGIDALVEGDKVVVDLLLCGLAVIEFDVVLKLSDGAAGEAFGWIVELGKNPVFKRSCSYVYSAPSGGLVDVVVFYVDLVYFLYFLALGCHGPCWKNGSGGGSKEGRVVILAVARLKHCVLFEHALVAFSAAHFEGCSNRNEV